MFESLPPFIKRVTVSVRRFVREKRKVFSDEIAFSNTHQLVHFWMLVVKHFQSNRCLSRAASLAFSTLLALVPLLAIVLSISTSVIKTQDTDQLRPYAYRLVESVAPQLEELTLAERTLEGENADGEPEIGVTPEENGEDAQEEVQEDAPEDSEPSDEEEASVTAIDQVVDQIMSFVGNVQPGTIGASGIVALIAIALSLMVTVESAFNDIWGLNQGRKWWMRLILYWTVLTLGSILIIAATSLSIATKFEDLGDSIPFTGFFVPFLPFFMAAVAFTIFYLTVPNVAVRVPAAVIGGVIGAILWQINKEGTGFFADKILRDASIYGSFAVVPVMMFGIYLFWVILLFGAQVAYAFQHRQTYMLKRLAERIHFSGREFAAMRIMTLVGKYFQKGKKAPTAADISKTLELPEQLTEELLDAFSYSHLIEVSDGQNEFGRYLPARTPDKISAYDILMSLREGKGQNLETASDADRQRVRHELDRIRNAEMEVAKKIKLTRLVGSNSSQRRRRPSREKPVTEPSGSNS